MYFNLLNLDLFFEQYSHQNKKGIKSHLVFVLKNTKYNQLLKQAHLLRVTANWIIYLHVIRKTYIHKFQINLTHTMIRIVSFRRKTN